MKFTDCFTENSIIFCKVDSSNVIVGDNETKSGAYDNNEISNLVIPELANGKNVIEIGACSFYGKRKLTVVTILAKIVQINQNAFFGCVSLSYINIPSSTKLISQFAFSLKDDTATSSGTLKIIFDYPSSIAHIGTYAIERKENFIVYFNGRKAPNFETGAFWAANSKVVYSPVKTNFGGVMTTVLASFCQTLVHKNMQHCSSRNLLLTFLLSYSI